MKQTMTMLGVLLLAIALSSCRTRVGDLTALSTKNVPHDFRQKGEGEGSDRRYYILIFPTRLTDPVVREAIDDAIDSEPGGDVLLNGRITWRAWYLPPLFGWDGFSVKGDVASTRDYPR